MDIIIVAVRTPNLPTNIVPTNIARVKLSGRLPMDMRIPPLQIKIMLESNPLKSKLLIGGLGVRKMAASTTPLGIASSAAAVHRTAL